MRECRSSGSVEGVMGNHGSYSDSGRMSMAAYSLDLRKRVMRAWDGGMDAESVAAKYEVSRAWCIGWDNGGARPGPVPPPAPKKVRPPDLAGHPAPDRGPIRRAPRPPTRRPPP